MRLKELADFNNIVIQGHDNPDADAVASCYGLYMYFLSLGKKVRMIYGGRNEIRKSNLVLMLDKLNIPFEYTKELDEIPELLLTVDCQYGERNVQKFDGKTVAIIDHHIAIPRSMIKRASDEETDDNDELALVEIRDNYGACATVVWDMLKAEGFEAKEHEELATALYYGLFMDTGKLQEVRHPKDKDMRDELEFCLNRNILTLLENSNISQEELKIAGDAMSKVDFLKGKAFAIAEAEKCDPNILGIISDALIEVDSIGSCIALCALDDGVKLSLRSCEKETRADELARFVTEGIGSGGGHMRKAGGFIVNDLLTEEFHRLIGDKCEDMAFAAHAVLTLRVDDYFKNQEYIYAGTDVVPDLTGEKVYKKKCLPIGYVKATDMYPEGTAVTVRMLEGDLPFVVKSDTYFIIGIEGEVYKNDEEYFLSHNTPTDEPYIFKGEYAPTVHTAVKAETFGDEEHTKKSLMDYAKTCIPKQGSYVCARQINKRTKVFVSWSDNYMLGVPGDYLAARKENPKDVYIINKNIMAKSYELVED